MLASVLEGGRAVTGLDYQEIMLRRMTLSGQFATLFQAADLMLTPVQPFPPLTLAEIQTLGEQPELILKLQRYTAPFDLTGTYQSVTGWHRRHPGPGGLRAPDPGQRAA